MEVMSFALPLCPANGALMCLGVKQSCDFVQPKGVLPDTRLLFLIQWGLRDTKIPDSLQSESNKLVK